MAELCIGRQQAAAQLARDSSSRIAIYCYGKYDTLIFAAVRNPVFWTSILYLAVVSSVLAFLFLNYGSNYVSVSKATIFANFTTVISIFAGVFVLHENFTLQQMIGVIIILISVYIAR